MEPVLQFLFKNLLTFLYPSAVQPLTPHRRAFPPPPPRSFTLPVYRTHYDDIPFGWVVVVVVFPLPKEVFLSLLCV